MNVTELARKLHINTKELLDVLPTYGFDIGKKAIKIDDKTADQVQRKWKYIKRDLEEKKRKEAEERKLKERELRKEMGKTVMLDAVMTVKEFSERLELPTSQVIMELMKNGILANQNQDIDYDTMAIMAEEMGFNVAKEGDEEQILDVSTDEKIEQAMASSDNLQKRAPVIVVMGHVDHGKTKLLDTIRQANIIDTEAGGITQHIGAYQTVWKDSKNKTDDRAITFIDTPGHEAFTMMRSRGAKVADIAILIIAADDSVKPQTEEAINIIKAAKLPYVVAINKIDAPGADVQKVKTDLSTRGILPEEWGGTVPMVEISAKENQNIDKLLDMLLLVADMNEEKIKADPTLPAIGTVIESHVDKSMGPVATVLVQSGTLNKKDKLVIHDEIYGNVRAMHDYTGTDIERAGPSVPVQIIGFKVAPEVGDVLDLTHAEIASDINIKKKKTQQTGAERATIVDANKEDEDEKKKKTLNLVIKADVLGSLEAIIASLGKIRHPEVGVKIVGKGLGNITEDDVAKAEAGEATMIGFNVHPTSGAEETMRDKKITFIEYSIIYDLINWVKEELGKLLSDELIIEEVGKLDVIAIFLKEKGSMIVGGKVTTGKAQKNVLARVIREGVNMGRGKILAVQIGQASVKEAVENTECGVKFEGSVKIEVGDTLEFFTEETKAREIIFE